MKLNKKLIESIVVLCSLCVMAITAVTNDGNVEAKTVASNESTEVANTGLQMNGVAGVSGVLAGYQVAAAEKLGDTVGVEATNIDVVTATAEEAEEPQQETEEATEQEPQLTPEEQEWQNYLMSNIDSSLNVRAEASIDAEVVGKLYKGDRAEIVEQGSEWTKITSGNVTGYVSNEYCVVGTDALNYAKANCKTVATAKTGGLNVRRNPDTSASIASVLAEGEQITVDNAAESVEGWVPVICDSQTCYVSAEYVDVTLLTGTGITLEEEEAQRAAAAKAAEEAAAKEAAKKASQAPATTQGAAVDSNVDDVTLLAALIYCEAGGENYDCQLAVGAVVANRMKSGSFPSSLQGVIYQSGQFTPAASGKLSTVLANGRGASCVAAAQAALAGQDNTEGALYFRDSNCGRTGNLIGGMVFY